MNGLSKIRSETRTAINNSMSGNMSFSIEPAVIYALVVMLCDAISKGH